jgi:parallel beta-helix repeat protein
VRIVNNRMEQMAGEAILGMWLQGSQAAPFTDFEITGNQIVVNNLQGILINNSHGGVIADNRLYRATKGDDEQSPTVLLRENTTGVTLKGNQLGAEISDLSKGDNPAKGNSVARGDRNIFKTGDRP